MKHNYFLMACKLYICFIPALSILFFTYENWSALILSALLCVTSAHEIRKEDAK